MKDVFTTGVRLGVTLGGRHAFLDAPVGGDTLVFTGALDVNAHLGEFLDALAKDAPALDLGDLASALGDLPVVLSSLDCRYETGGGAVSGSFGGTCKVGSAGTARFFYNTTASTGGGAPASSALGLSFDGSIDLSGTPLFGALLADVAVNRFALVHTTAAADSIPLPSADGTPASLNGPFPAGTSITFTVRGPDAQQTIVLPLGGDSVRAAALPGNDPKPAGGMTKWFPVQKTLGPLSIQRIGAGYVNQHLSLLVDASLTVSALTLSLKEFSLGVTLSILADPLHPHVAVGLGGLGVSFDSSAAKVSGGFLEITRDGVTEYDGSARIEAASFTLSAIGAYATDANGDPSVFVFALLDRPLGGPAFFFVTGVAAGFGYGRALLPPTLDVLPQFPLVSAAMADASHPNPFAGKDDDPAKALTVLAPYVPPMPGENWLALGVRFTSFEMIQSFALATLTFGADTRIGLLGLSAITVPTGAPDPIAFAELALEASFQPATGLLAVTGALTPSSYILSRDCKLTGGFAFYTWFKDLGLVKAGEFVITLGGYHPLYHPPDGYPIEPRLAANWQVNDNLSVKGSFYFALTPSAVMGGGALEVNWQSGDLRAWFDTAADFLLSWKPFHYSAHIDLTLGASYRLNLLFTSKTITVSLGVSLDLWGPSFAGRAQVDLYVVSFTISFGDSRPKIDPISWSDFKSTFLPPPPAPSLSGFLASTERGVTCDVRVTGGLVRDLTAAKQQDLDIDWVLDAEDLELTAWTVCPVTQASLVTKHENQDKQTGVPGDWTQAAFGVGPVGIADGSLVSVFTVSLCRTNLSADRTQWIVDGYYDASTVVTPRPVQTGIPTAAWKRDTALNPVMTDVNTKPRVVDGALTGVAVRSNQTAPVHPRLPIPIAKLQAKPARADAAHWLTPEIATYDTFPQPLAMDILMSSIDSGPGGTRAAVLAALGRQGVALPEKIDVTPMTRLASTVLLSAPVLMYLGEEPTP